MNRFRLFHRVLEMDRSILRAFLRLDRHPLGSLVWRLLLVLACFRPWAWRFEGVAFGPETLAPEILQAAREAGVDPFQAAAWPTFAGVALRQVALAAGFALAWWGLSRLRRLLARRLGPGAWAALVPAGGYVALQLGLGSRSVLLRSVASQDLFSHGVPVWQGWAIHPLLWEPALSATLGLLAFLGVLVGELLFLFVEGRALLREAQDGALRARLTPHFLYNAFNTLGAQIRRDPEGAEETTQRLSGLFEQVSRATEHPKVPLSRELAFVEDYLALERRRLGERLQVRLEIDEVWLDVPVPVLGLQVLVENALKHAIAPRSEGGTLAITAQAEGRYLWIAVRDSGDGLSRASNGTGQALSNLRARLARASDLVLESTVEGFEARFRVAL